MESLSRFHSANKVDSYSRGGKKGKEKKNTEETTEQVQTQE